LKKFFAFVLSSLILFPSLGWGEMDLHRALLKGQAGEWIRVKNPGGLETVTVITRKNRKTLTLEVHTYRKKKPQSWVEQVFNLASQKLVRCRIKFPDGTIDELPIDQYAVWLETLENHDYKSVGIETIKVPAGTFECEHYRAIVDDNLVHVWINKEVPVTGLVKSRFRGGSTRLLEYGEEGVQPIFK